MSENFEFDEDAAVKFIRNYVGETVSSQYSDDEILYVIDTIWDYYEKNGMLSLDSDITDDELLDVDKLVTYVRKEVSNDDELEMNSKDIDKIVKAELEYEESLEDFI